MMEFDAMAAPWLHVRFEGRVWDLPLAELDLEPTSSDDAVRHALAGYLNVPVSSFHLYVVEHHTNGNLTVRPDALLE